MKITIKAARVNAGYTLTEAAKLLGVNKDTLSNWERGATSPRLKSIEKLVKLYKCTPEDLFMP